jgi:F0F1-type ATP synthase gamma subunit
MINIRDIKKKRDNIATLGSISSSLQMISSTKRFQYLKKLSFLEEIEQKILLFRPDYSLLSAKKTLYIVLSCDQRFCKNFLNLLNKKLSEIPFEKDNHLVVFGKYSSKTACLLCPTFKQYRVISNFYECELIASKIIESYSQVFVCSYLEKTNSFGLTNLTKSDETSDIQKISSFEFLKTYLALSLYRLSIENGIKEESDRSLAMSEASENAKNLTKELDRLKNQIRQGQITKEITSV